MNQQNCPHVLSLFLWNQLASATAADFVLWSPEQKSVTKHKVHLLLLGITQRKRQNWKRVFGHLSGLILHLGWLHSIQVSSRVCSADWTKNGQYLALGQFNGHISIRDKNGIEKVRIERSAPIWTLKWTPGQTAGQPDVLAVGDWNKTLSFYELNGDRHGSKQDIKLGFDPCCISYYDGGEYILIGGSCKEVRMYTKEGKYLSTVAKLPAWVWTVQPRPEWRQIVVGCNDGIYISFFVFILRFTQ
jgi:intraflagellar transport protein 122